MNPAPNLFFIGPMGAGKTTIGRGVAELVGLPFFDLDHEIEAHCGAGIPLIFDIEGETGFRQRESAALAELTARSNIVLATGGGAVLAEENRQLLRVRGFIVYLETTVDEQLQRLARDPLYRQIADLTVPAGPRKSTGQVAQRLAAELKSRWQRASPDHAEHAA